MTSSQRLCSGVLAVLLVSVAHAQNPVSAFPQNYRLVLDNKDVAVLRVHYGPHETVGIHDHSAYTTVYIYLNDSGPVLFHHKEAKPFEITRPPTHTGAFRVSPGRIERHTVKNLSDLSSEFVRVELKRMPIRTLRDEFRGPAPDQPLTPGTSTVYQQRPLEVQRTICAPNSGCTLAASLYPSVLIAIQPLTVQVNQENLALTSAQPAAWIPVGASSSLHNSSTAPVQALRLILRKP